MYLLCIECGAVLTDEERHYYGNRCEKCERAEFERVESWRHGGQDEELDRIYDAPKPTQH